MQDNKPFITTFTRLGEFLAQFPEGKRSTSPGLRLLNEAYFEVFLSILETEHIYNPWFTRESIHKAFHGISLMLQKDVLSRWLQENQITGDPPKAKPKAKPKAETEAEAGKTVGLVLAGNIPLVGFHDILCVLAAGHRVLAKPSSKDDRLVRKIAELIAFLDPGLGRRITLSEGILRGMDAVIATGSDNSARYFEYYFRNLPHIIRKNRNGVAVLTGEETEKELAGIGEDIFSYFGMGCRNVTKLFVPADYDLKVLLGVLDRFDPLRQHHKYANNVAYHRTIYLMNRIPFLDNEVLLLKEDPGIASPVGVVYYERYSEIEWVQDQLKDHSEKIQCVISLHPDIPGALLPGSTQEPMPWDYADGVDTIRFLKEEL